jgi:hypothetical protein
LVVVFVLIKKSCDRFLYKSSRIEKWQKFSGVADSRYESTFLGSYKRLFRISGENGSVSLWLTPAGGPFPREVLFLLSAKTHQSRGFSNPYWQFTVSVPYATLIFGKLRNLTGLSPREPIQCLLFPLIH